MNGAERPGGGAHEAFIDGRGAARLRCCDARTLRLNAEGDESAGGMRYMRPALIVLAAGVATALAIGAAGNAAEDNNPTVDGSGPGDADDTCYDLGPGINGCVGG